MFPERRTLSLGAGGRVMLIIIKSIVAELWRRCRVLTYVSVSFSVLYLTRRENSTTYKPLLYSVRRDSGLGGGPSNEGRDTNTPLRNANNVQVTGHYSLTALRPTRDGGIFPPCMVIYLVILPPYNHHSVPRSSQACTYFLDSNNNIFLDIEVYNFL